MDRSKGHTTRNVNAVEIGKFAFVGEGGTR